MLFLGLILDLNSPLFSPKFLLNVHSKKFPHVNSNLFKILILSERGLRGFAEDGHVAGVVLAEEGVVECVAKDDVAVACRVA